MNKGGNLENEMEERMTMVVNVEGRDISVRYPITSFGSASRSTCCICYEQMRDEDRKKHCEKLDHIMKEAKISQPLTPDELGNIQRMLCSVLDEENASYG